MNYLPRQARTYIILVSFTALVLLALFSVSLKLSYKLLEATFFFSILAIFTDLLKVRLPKGGYVAVTFAITYCCIILFGAAVSSYVTIIGAIVSSIFNGTKSPWYKLIFNCSQYVISISFAYALYLITGGIVGSLDPFNVASLVASAGGYFLINGLAVTVILALVQGSSPWGIWVTNLKWTLPNMFTLSIVGFLMAVVYNYAGYWGVSLFFGPLLLARYIFKSYMEVREVYLNTLSALASALDAKDKYTRGHSERVAKYAVELARRLKFPEDKVEVIEHMALLHDIGKIGVSGDILTRTGQLTSTEFDLIKLHPEIGANILKEIHDLGSAVEFVRHHHERFDGTGYPNGLSGETIPLGARIIALADAFDAMTSDRAYRQKATVEEALEEVRRSAGTHFDPQLAETFINCWNDMEHGHKPNHVLQTAANG